MFLVRIVEWETGKEYLLPMQELPPILARSISMAEPVSLRTITGESPHIADMTMLLFPKAEPQTS